MNTLAITDTRTDVIRIRGADLDLTLSPLFSVGYRMPHGFGEFLFSYSFLTTQGEGLTPTDQGLAHQKSRLDVNYWDFDYANREFSLGPHWDMRWLVGVRLANVFFDAHSVAAMPLNNQGENLVEQSESSNFLGAGPHVGMDLAWKMDPWRLAWFFELHGAYLWGHIGQNFTETLTFPGADDMPLHGTVNDSVSQGVGTISLQAGLRWSPPIAHASSVFLGYHYEVWGQVGRDDNTGSRADFYENGIFLRGEFTF
jgi:hypothetical protein